MTTLFTFPGQGVQKAGMLHQLLTDPVTEKILHDANEFLNLDLLSIDNDEALKNNKNTQIALTVVSVANAQLLASKNIKPNYVLGLSIGAFPAAVIAGVLSLEDGLHIVAKRGELMSNAYPEGFAMAAIIGLPIQQVNHIVQTINSTNLPCYIANINTESQIILSGSDEALQQACDLAIKQRATSAKRLKVNVPSHCELLQTQADELYQYLDAINVKRPKVSFVSANKARVLYDPQQIKHDLAYNMSNQVQWWQTAAMLQERGVNLVTEMKPGSVLTALCKPVMHNTICIAAASESNENIEELYRRFG